MGRGLVGVGHGGARLSLHPLGDWTDDARDLVVFPQDAYPEHAGLHDYTRSVLNAGPLPRARPSATQRAPTPPHVPSWLLPPDAPPVRGLAPCAPGAARRRRHRLQRAQRGSQNGWVKVELRFRRYGLRCVENVRGEWHLVRLAKNITSVRDLATRRASRGPAGHSVRA